MHRESMMPERLVLPPDILLLKMDVSREDKLKGKGETYLTRRVEELESCPGWMVFLKQVLMSFP